MMYRYHHPMHQANKNSPFGDLSKEEFYQKHQVVHHESFVINSRDMKLFTQSWRPAAPAGGTSVPELRGVVAMIHGYISESGWTFQLTAAAIAKLGFLVLALDLPGHGRSEGPRGHVASIGPVVDDCVQYFDAARSAHGARLPAFLYGESLGGAAAVMVYLRQKDRWDGLVLNGAMCGVSPKYKPPWPLEVFLPMAAWIAPAWRVPFTKSLVTKSYKEEWKRELVRRNPRAPPSEGPTAATSLELLRLSGRIRRRARELDLPLLVVHGSEDAVCDAESAELVYELASSRDKTFNVIPGMWHQMIGEPQESLELGFGVIFTWLQNRAKNAANAAMAASSNGHHISVKD